MSLFLIQPILFKEYLAKNTNLAESTIVEYSRIAAEFLISKEKINLDSQDDYCDFVISKHKTNRYNISYALISFVKYYHAKNKNLRDDIIQAINCLKPRKMPLSPQVRHSLQEQDYDNIFSNLKNQKHKVIMMLQSLIGLRVGDCLRLKTEDIHILEEEGAPVIKISTMTKGGRKKTFSIFDLTCQEILIDYLASSIGVFGYVFLTRGSRKQNIDLYHLQKINYWHYSNDLREAALLSGIESFSCHDFRRGFAARVYNISKRDINVLQKMLGHSRVETSLRYLQNSQILENEISRKIQGCSQ